jgi:hypothetical protein
MLMKMIQNSGVLLSMLILFIYKQQTIKIFEKLAHKFIHQKKRIEKQHLHKKIEKFKDCCFKLLYLIFISIFGYYICYDKNWFPSYLGGTGDLNLSFEREEVQDYNSTVSQDKLTVYNSTVFSAIADKQDKLTVYNSTVSQDKLTVYYQIQIGYRILDVLFQFKHKNRNDFQEMIIHHTVTLILLIWSYSVNHVKFGIIIALLHDMS